MLIGLKFPAVLLLAAALLAGCAAGEAASRSDQSPPQKPPAPVAEPAEDEAGEKLFVNDPASPYPMTVERWSVDMDGDGTDELVTAITWENGQAVVLNQWFEWYY